LVFNDDKKQIEMLDKIEQAGIFIRKFNLQNSETNQG
jgi:hypothetical protein